LIGSLKPLIVPFFAAVFDLLLRQFSLTIPHELSEAARSTARIDPIYWSIICRRRRRCRHGGIVTFLGT
jgi:ABC-type glycerol-3-phosphate transport system permease component